MQTFPLNNTLYNAEDMGAYFSTRVRGVYSSSTDYAVTKSANLTVTVAPGRAWLSPTEFWGLMAWQNASMDMEVSLGPTGIAANSTLILRYIKATNSSELIMNLETGTTPHVPVHTEDIEELSLAFISANFTSGITNIRDLRADEAYCGVMRDGVTGIPTAGLLQIAEDKLQADIDNLLQVSTDAAQDAASSATTAVSAEATATSSATLSQSWAVGGTGTRAGEDTNNAKYWSDEAQNAAGGGVVSFKGRTGSVIPQTGDYNKSQITGLPEIDTQVSANTSDIAALKSDGGGFPKLVYTGLWKRMGSMSITATRVGVPAQTRIGEYAASGVSVTCGSSGVEAGQYTITTPAGGNYILYVSISAGVTAGSSSGIRTVSIYQGSIMSPTLQAQSSQKLESAGCAAIILNKHAFTFSGGTSYQFWANITGVSGGDTLGTGGFSGSDAYNVMLELYKVS